MEIKALIFDVDGTLLDSKGHILPSTITALKMAKEKKYKLGLCTGREALSVQNLLASWNIEGLIDFIIGNGGSEILDFNFNIDESKYPLDGQLIKEIVDHFKDLQVNFAIPQHGCIYTFKDDSLIKRLSEFDRIPYQVVDMDEFLQSPRPKVMITCDEEEMIQVIKRAETFSSDNYKSASLKTASVLYEYMDPRISKTDGIESVLQHYNYALHEVCCFGDADNDADMVQNAGIGVVMGNGSQKTKNVADFITDDNDNDGIYNYITNHLLKK